MDLFRGLGALLSCCVVTAVLVLPYSSLAATADCPCRDKSHCNLIEIGPRQEVLGFSNHRGRWIHYDWTKITTVAVFRDWDEDAVEMMCYAHSKNVRVVLVGFFDVANLTHPDRVQSWIGDQLSKAVQFHADGINIDVEQPIAKGHAAEAEELVQLVAKTRDTFHARFPHSQVTFDVAWSPDHVDRRWYDAKGIADASDFLVVMSYDEQGQIYEPSPCVAGPNSGLQQTIGGLNGYIKLNISPGKLVLGQPWYGYDYTCLDSPSEEPAGCAPRDKVPVCNITTVPYEGAYCSDAAGTQKEYVWVMRMLEGNASCPGRMWDAKSMAPYFDFIDQSDKRRHQVWYDDPVSLTLKYQLVQKMHLRGLAFWGTDFLDYEGTTEAKAEAKVMWDVVDVAI